MTRNLAGLAALVTSVSLFAAAPSALAAYSAADTAAMLRGKGYHSVRIANDGPGYHALACRGKAQYHFEISPSGRILDRDRAGKCGAPPSGVHVRAPFVAVDTGRGTHVRAPFVGVDKTDRGTRVRAPFVDLWIPKRRN